MSLERRVTALEARHESPTRILFRNLYEDRSGQVASVSDFIWPPIEKTGTP
ncbi:hypothetical protein ACVISU_004220 [Bradyrhizobium sp. USDA 4452]